MKPILLITVIPIVAVWSCIALPASAAGELRIE